MWWVTVLQLKTFLLTIWFTSHFSHNMILLWLCGFLLLLLPGLFFTCKTYRLPFLVKGSHLIYIASYQELQQLQQGACSGKCSIFRSYSPRSKRKSWNISKYVLRKADQCAQSVALSPITVTSAFLTKLGISSACLVPYSYSSCSEILLLATSPNLLWGLCIRLVYFIWLWGRCEMPNQNVCGKVKCESTLCTYWKSRRVNLHCWNICRAREHVCVCSMHLKDIWFMKKLIFLTQCGCQSWIKVIPYTEKIITVSSIIVAAVTSKSFFSPKLCMESSHYPNKYSRHLYLLCCSPASVWYVLTLPH